MKIKCPYCKQLINEPTNCLNDGKHNYVKIFTYPKKFSKLICEMCGNVKY